MSDGKKLYLFFASLRSDIIEQRIAGYDVNETAALLRSFAEGMLSLEKGSLQSENTVVMLPDMWLEDRESVHSDRALHDEAQWYMQTREKGLAYTSFGGQTVYKNTAAAIAVVAFEAEMKEGPDQVTPQEKSESAAQSSADTAWDGTVKPSLKRKIPAAGLPWENVYVFISSTFNDMHAERDYLVKKVFPELSEWCAERRLRLVDIDLRWGITEEDSENNKRVVEVCLRNIDRCRPFFLCILGQRRGWVPSEGDISDGTFGAFPKLSEHMGSSVTEMEVLHALIDPMHNGKYGNGEEAEHAFFYLRDNSYLDAVTYQPLRNIFTNEGESDPDTANRELARFREQVIPGTGRPVHHYKAVWNESASTPELHFSKKRDDNLTKGRLGDFSCEGEELSVRIIADLKAAITVRYGNRTQTAATSLQKEIAEQSKFMQLAAEGFIEREGDYAELDGYLDFAAHQPFVICAQAGMGKTSYLANYIEKSNRDILYRFAGTSDDSCTPEGLAASILEELHEAGRLQSAIPKNPAELLMEFPGLLAEAAQSKPLILFIDALDQLSGGVAAAYFLPAVLPENMKLVTSFKLGGEDAERYLQAVSEYAVLYEMRPFSSEEDKRSLVDAYLKIYLKELDDSARDILVSQKGSDNPLFLKVVLSELRIFGSHENLRKKIEDTFGDTPESAFAAVLKRIEEDPAYCKVNMRPLLSSVFGWLSHTRFGLSAGELCELILQSGLTDNESDALDAVYTVMRPLRPYLVSRDGRFDFFFDAFRTACIARYEAEKPAALWHGKLGAYFEGKPLQNRHKLMELAYQYSHAGMTREYEAVLSSYLFVQARLEGFGVTALIEDAGFGESAGANLLKSFYELAAASLYDHPEFLAQELWARLADEENSLCRQLLADAVKAREGQPWLRPVFSCFDRPGGEFVRVYRSAFEFGGYLALSPDDRTMVTRMGAYKLAVWDIASGQIIRNIELSAVPVRIMFSPDGKTLAASVREGGGLSIIIWDAASFEQVCRLPSGLAPYTEIRNGMHYSADPKFAYTNDSACIIAKNSYGEIKLFKTDTGKPASSADFRYDAFCYGTGGKTLVAVGSLHMERNEKGWGMPYYKRSLCPIGLFEYDQSAGRMTAMDAVLEGHDTSVKCIAVSCDDRLVASAGVNGVVKLWYVGTRKLLCELNTDKMGVTALEFLRHGDSLMVTGSDGIIRIFSTQTFECQREIPCKFGYISDARLFSDGSHCAALSGQNEIKLVALSRETDKVSCGEGINSIGRSSGMLAASSYTNYVAAGHLPVNDVEASGHIHFFDTESNHYLHSKTLRHVKNRDFVYVAPDANAVMSKDCTGTQIPTIRHWPLEDCGSALPGDSFTLPGFGQSRFSEGFPNHYRFSSDGQFLVAYNDQKHTISVFRTKSGRLMGEIKVKGKSNRSALEYEVTPDGSVLYSFNAETGELSTYIISKQKLKKTVRVKSFMGSGFSHDHNFNNDGMRLFDKGRKLFYSGEFMVYIIDIERAEIVFALNRSQNKSGLNRSDGNCFASDSENGRILCMSRALFGEKTLECGRARDVVRRECVEVWDTAKKKLVASFYAQGHVSNILIDKNHFTFGQGNGELATLELENYEL